MGRKASWQRLLPGIVLLFVLATIVAGWHRLRRTSPSQPEEQTEPATRQETRALPSGEYSEVWYRMIEQDIRGRGIDDEIVLDAMSRVPRHEFVSAQYVPQAYADHPLPIGYGQTISQPYIVALMTDLLAIKAGDKVLEIGTGSGYQAAILAEITSNVYSVEIIPELAQAARERLQRLGYDSIQLLNADGYTGWPEHAPYDAIIVTAAPDHIPQALVQQLEDGGRMVIPVGPVGGYQTLWRLTKDGDTVRNENMGGVSFVPLTGKH